MEKKFDIKEILRIGGILFLICALTALLLAAVNQFTKDAIAENALKKMNDSISRIFGDDIADPKKMDVEVTEPAKEVYEIHSAEGELMGYAVRTVPVGFKGDVELMVGVSVDCKVKSVEILSMSETPGIGTKIEDSEYLNSISGTSVDSMTADSFIISGATYSSRAVNEGIASALQTVGGIIG